MQESRPTIPDQATSTDLLAMEAPDGFFHHAWFELRKRKLALFAVSALILLYSIGILAPLVATHDYSETNLAKPQAAPDAENWLGTDRLGRDIFSRVVWGIQTTVILTLVTTLTASVILGLIFGMAAGYLRGIADILISRIGEVIAVIPDVLLLLIIVATVRPRIKEFGYWIEDNTFISGVVSSGVIDYIVLGIAFLPISWFGSMRLIRGQTLAIRTAPYVDAARSMGVGTPTILLRHILPNVITPLVVSVSFGMGAVALGEVIISFLRCRGAAPASKFGCDDRRRDGADRKCGGGDVAQSSGAAAIADCGSLADDILLEHTRRCVERYPEPARTLIGGRSNGREVEGRAGV